MTDLMVIDGEAVDPPTLKRRPRPRRTCVVHRHLVLDHEARRVYCDDCGSEVDPFDGLAMISREYDRWAASRDSLKAEATRKGRELEDLRRQIRNARARLRTAER